MEARLIRPRLMTTMIQPGGKLSCHGIFRNASIAKSKFIIVTTFHLIRAKVLFIMRYFGFSSNA